MQIRSAPPGPASLFTMAAFGRPDAEYNNQLQVRNQQMQQQLLHMHGFDASNFFARSSNFFNFNYELTGMKQAETMISMGMVDTSSTLDFNIFTPIRYEEDFTKANSVQRIYLMANPNIREAFLGGSIFGYQNNYTNLWGDAIGFEDPVYRQAISGASQSSYMALDPEVDEAYYECLDDSIEGLAAPSAIEQSNILQAWRLQDVLHAEGIDTTDPELKPIKG